MPGKKKDPNKTYSPNWGGDHGGGKKGLYPLRQMKLPITDEELAFILDKLQPRQRVEAMLREARQRDPSHPNQNQ